MDLSKAIEHKINIWYILNVKDLHHIAQAFVDPILLAPKD